MLKYPGEWSFAGPEEVPPLPTAVASLFHSLLVKVSSTVDDQKSMIEKFKTRFGDTGTSTALGWAISDLDRAMQSTAQNSVAFLDALWDCIKDAKRSKLKTPSETQINTILQRNGIPFQIRDPDLIRVGVDAIISNDPTPNSQTTQYKLGALLGKGGFGEVYVATRETSAATFEYALKLLRPHPFSAQTDALERFRREVRILQALQHRGIVAYVDAGIDGNGRPYLVMPYIRGQNIRDATEGKDPMTAVGMVKEVLLALAYAHESEILHRDIKPTNVIVRSSDQQPIILDFGASYIFDDLDEQSLTNTAVGSAGYIPSEVLANPKIRSPLHDIFSCAVITYELIGRRRPDPQQYVPLALHHPQLTSLDDVLKSALGPANGRPPSAKALHDALAACG